MNHTDETKKRQDEAGNKQSEAGNRLDETPRATKSRGGFARIINALRYSLEGLGASFRYEAAFRQEMLMCIVLLPTAILLPAPLTTKALLIFSVLTVLVVELLNSAMEWTVDYISQATHPYAKRAKDMGSAAVFLSIVAMVIVWVLVLCDTFL